MMCSAHIFDIDCLITIDNKVLIINKNYPLKPLIRLPLSEFNLIKNGVYKGKNLKLKLDGEFFYFPENIYNEIKIICKINNYDVSDIKFSFREFIDEDVIKTLNYNVNKDVIKHLKNTSNHIYVMCSKNSRKNYKPIIKTLKKELKNEGLVIKKIYYMSKTFHNRDEDRILYNKIRLSFQTVIGLKTRFDKFINKKLFNYNEVYIYDDDINVFDSFFNYNMILKRLIQNSELDVKLKIKNIVQNNDKTLYINLVTPNKINPFKTHILNINWHDLK